jgi:hypothetical protein
VVIIYLLRTFVLKRTISGSKISTGSNPLDYHQARAFSWRHARRPLGPLREFWAQFLFKQSKPHRANVFGSFLKNTFWEEHGNSVHEGRNNKI